MQSPKVELVMSDDGQRLFLTGNRDPPHLNVAPPLRMDVEAEAVQDSDDFLP